jgi:hypothetical protein
LLDFGRVAMGRHAVGLHVLVGLGEQVHRVGLPALRARSGDAGLAVDDDAVGGAPPALEQRSGGEHRAHRIATRRGDQGRSRDLLAMQLGHPVDRLRETGRVFVGSLVPGRVERGISQAVVRRQIDGLAAVATQGRHQALRLHVGQRKEDEVGFVG